MKCDVLDTAMAKRGNHLDEAALLKGRIFIIRHLQDGAPFREERFASEGRAMSRWAVVKESLEQEASS